MKPALKNALWAVGVTLAVLVAYTPLRLFDRFENAFVDLRFRLRGVEAPSPDVALVAIDDKSLKALGLYPWPRDVHARMTDLLTRAGAAAVVFDVLFLEEDREHPRADRAFGRAAAAGGRTVLGFLLEDFAGGAPAKVSLPIRALESDRTSLGFVNAFPESDGTVRMASLWWNTPEGQLMPSLALSAVAAARGQTPEALAQALAGTTTGAWHEITLNYTGWDDERGSPFPYFSYAEVLAGRVPPATFKDKIVLVCGTATGLFDTQPVPNLRNFPGPEIHANAIDNIVTGRSLRPVSPYGTLLAVLALGLAAGGLFARVSVRAGAGLATGGVIGYFLLAQALFTHGRVLINYTVPTAALLAVYVTVLFRRLLAEEREKRRIKSTFAQYLSPKVIDILIRDPSRLRLGGEEREMTVFFSDIAGFTGVSEKITPRELVAVLNEYLSAMTDIILARDGVLDKYIGDAIMAFWNAPVDQPGHAALACRAALEQRAALNKIRTRFQEKGWPLIDCRMGLNTGPAIIGNMGSHTRFDYTVVGDTVNLASRLESANKTFGTRVLISEATRAAAGPAFATRELDFLTVKGKTKPLRVYELVAETAALSPDAARAIDRFHECLALYRGRAFDRARAALTDFLRAWPDDRPARLYLERCEEFILHPPAPDWDGVYVMKNK